MTDIRELYQEMILEHNRQPRNFKRLENASQSVEGYNPLCGDRMKVYLKMDGDVICDVSFEGTGCAISKASASMMTVCIKGKTRAEARALFDLFHHMVSSENKSTCDSQALGKLAVFSGICDYPARVKCAILAWHTLKAALEGAQSLVSTEGDGGGEGA